MAELVVTPDLIQRLHAMVDDLPSMSALGMDIGMRGFTLALDLRRKTDQALIQLTTGIRLVGDDT